MAHSKQNRAVCCLAIGEVYFRNAIACLQSFKNHFVGNDVEYFILFANVDLQSFINNYKINWIKFVDITDTVNDFVAETDNPLLFRQFKRLPFSHSALEEYDVLYLDCDCLCFNDKIQTIFDIIQRQSVVIFGGYRPADVDLRYKGESFILSEKAKEVGIDVRNMSLNSGFVGRASDRKGLLFASLLDDLLIRKPLRMPDGYFNDEPYFMIAYQQAMENSSISMENLHSNAGLSQLPVDLYSIFHPSRYELLEADGGSFNVKRLKDGDVVSRPAIIHFIQFSRCDVYLKEVSRILESITRNRKLLSFLPRAQRTGGVFTRLLACLGLKTKCSR